MKWILILTMSLVTPRVFATELPPVERPDVIRIEQNYPKKVLIELKDSKQIEPVLAFINSRPNNWDVPWFGPPVGQVYLLLIKNNRVTANFYVGPWFFGRDHGNFWSQKTTEQEVAQLEKLLGVPLVEILKRAESKHK